MRFLPSVAYNLMYRDINLRTSASQKSDNQSLRLVDSRGKRGNNNKISIYSQKYTLVQNQTQRQEVKLSRTVDPKLNEHFIINPLNPNIRTTSVMEKNEDHLILQSVPQQKLNQQTANLQTTSSRDQKSLATSVTINSLKEYVQSVRIFYQAKIKQIVEENARTMNELRNLLMQQQHRIAEKEQIINRILTTSHRTTSKTPPIRFNTQSPTKVISRVTNPNANHQYLCNKVKDLQASMKIVMDHFIASEDEIKNKIHVIQHDLIRYFSKRITKCWARVGHFAHQFQKKCSNIETQLAQKQTNPIHSDISQVKFKHLQEEMNSKIRDIEKDINNFSTKQFKYENERVQNLQIVLINLMEKIDLVQKRNQLQNSRKMENGYFLEDEDEFFYPTSDRRVYEPNDDYEHFQSQSEDERSIIAKENVSQNRLHLRALTSTEKSKNF